MTLSCSFIWDEFLYLGILSVSAFFSVLAKPVMSPAPEINDHVKKRSHSAQDPALQGVSLTCAAYTMLLCFDCFNHQATNLQRLSMPAVGNVWPLA